MLAASRDIRICDRGQSNSKYYLIYINKKMHMTIARLSSFTHKLKEVRIILDPKCVASKGARCVDN